MQHELLETVHVVKEYNLNTLGAPFDVILVNGVCVDVDEKTGKEKVTIPDLPGLILAVVRSRVTHPRKLSGLDIKFIRKALSVQAKVLAEFLEISAEHLSRCESGKHGINLSSANEKQLRLAAFLGTFFEEPQILFASGSDLDAAERKPTKQQKSFERLVKLFFSMKIQPFHNPNEPLEIKLTRRPADESMDLLCGCQTSDGEWDGDEPIAA